MGEDSAVQPHRTGGVRGGEEGHTHTHTHTHTQEHTHTHRNVHANVAPTLTWAKSRDPNRESLAI